MSARKDLMDRLADARPSRLDPDHRPDPAGIMAHARSHQHPPVRRPIRRRVLVGLVPTAAVVAVGAVLLASGGLEAGRRQPRAAGRPPSAVATTGAAPEAPRDLFLVAAAQTLKTGGAHGRRWLLDTEMGEAVQVGPPGRPYRIMRRAQAQQWLPTRAGDHEELYDRSLGAAPITAADRAAWRADGSPARWKQPAPDGLPATVITAAPDAALRGPRRVPGGPTFVFAGGALTMAELAALPDDPAALRRWVTGRNTSANGRQMDDYTLFILGEQLVFDLPVSAAVRAAAYRMLAEVQGAQVLGAVTDQHGRRGIGVGYTRKGDGGWVQSRLIVDPRTGQALADESWFFGAGASAAKQGTLTGYTLVLTAGYTDQEPPA